MDTESVQSVSQLTDSIKYSLSSDYPNVVVSGEISGTSFPQSGHIYLTLKDPSAQISTILWRSTVAKLRFVPEDGMQVLCHGYIDVYPQRGTYQLIARSLQPLGQGALQLAFRKLHDRLKKEGLFDEADKKQMPRIPRRVIVITSPSGAAIHDFLQVVSRRWPHLEILVYPVKVQGPEAAQEIATAIKKCSKNFPFAADVIVVTRGGGSVEDLWAFNEEAVVRAIYKCPIPVISAVGHEIDVSLSDLVADVRALTPSEAGEKLVPDKNEIDEYLNVSSQRIRLATINRVNQSRDRLNSMANRPSIQQPLTLIRSLGRQLDHFESLLTQNSNRKFEITRQRLKHFLEILNLSMKSVIPDSKRMLQYVANSPALKAPLETIDVRKSNVREQQNRLIEAFNIQTGECRQRLEFIAEKLSDFNPDNVLKRGYSLTVDELGQPLVDCKNVKTGDTIRTWVSNGCLVSRIENVDAKSSYLKNDKKEKKRR